MSSLPTITPKIAKKLKGKRVLLRLSLNVPIEHGVVQNDFRLKRVLPTLKLLHDSGAKTIAISHLGKDGGESLGPVAHYLGKFFPVGFLPDKDREKTREIVNHLQEGSLMVLENLRRFPGEMENSRKFCRELSALGDFYVNEDFAVSHREHASIVGLPHYLPSFIGPLFSEEVKHLSLAFKPRHPFVFILGGAKFETKIPLVKRFLRIADTIFISGALANTFFREMGYEMGKSLVDEKFLHTRTFARNKKVVLPLDLIVRGSGGVLTREPNNVRRDEAVFDAGEKTLQAMAEKVKEAKLIIWNGPLGKFEEGFRKSTETLAKVVAKSSAISIVGGGDTISAIARLKLGNKFTFLSTGGGAMLEFLAHKTLPGIEAIKRSRRS